MYIHELKPGFSVDLEFYYKNIAYSMKNSIYKTDDSAVYIPAIKEGDSVLTPDLIEQMKVVYKSDTGIYEFQPLDIQVVTFEDKYAYGIRCSMDIKRLNRRNFFRVFFGDMKTIVIKNENEIVNTVRGTLRDLSAGGMGVILPFQVPEGHILELELVTTRNQFRLQGIVIRSYELDRRKGYLHGCKFKEENSLLVRFLFEKQKKMQLNSKK